MAQPRLRISDSTQTSQRYALIEPVVRLSQLGVGHTLEMLRRRGSLTGSQQTLPNEMIGQKVIRSVVRNPAQQRLCFRRAAARKLTQQRRE